jgi:hypothetical protein
MVYNYNQQVYNSADPSNVCNYGQQVYISDKNANLANAVRNPSFNASTHAGSDEDSLSNLSSAESQWSPEPMGYMTYGGSVANQQQQQYYMTHGGFVANQQQEQSYVGPAVPMMPMLVAVVPTAMPMPVMAGMQPMPVASLPGPMPGPMPAGVRESDAQVPAVEKKERRLEDLLPRGRRPTSTRENIGHKIFVGGLNPKTTSEDLRGYFSSFGAIADSCVINDTITSESRGFGFIVFEEKIPEGLFDKQHIIDQRRCGVREYSQ